MAFFKKDEYSTTNGWFCPKCDTENSFSTNKCVECGTVNREIKPVNKKDNSNSSLFKGSDTKKSGYKCLECGTIYQYSFFCPECGSKLRTSAKSPISRVEARPSFSCCGLIVFEDEEKFKYENGIYLYEFEQLTSYELVEITDVETRKSGTVGNALVGGIIAGGVGAIVGASASKTHSNEIVKDMYISIVTNPGASLHKIQLIKYATKKSSIDYEIALENAQKILGMLKHIEQIAGYNKQSEETPVLPQSALSPLDEIKKLKELLDIGAVTQEEFDAKKKQLLNL